MPVSCSGAFACARVHLENDGVDARGATETWVDALRICRSITGASKGTVLNELMMNYGRLAIAGDAAHAETVYLHGHFEYLVNVSLNILHCTRSLARERSKKHGVGTDADESWRWPGHMRTNQTTLHQHLS